MGGRAKKVKTRTVTAHDGLRQVMREDRTENRDSIQLQNGSSRGREIIELLTTNTQQWAESAVSQFSAVKDYLLLLEQTNIRCEARTDRTLKLAEVCIMIDIA